MPKEDDKYRLQARAILSDWRIGLEARFGTKNYYVLEDEIRDALAEAPREATERAIDRLDIMSESLRAIAECDQYRGTAIAEILMEYAEEAVAIRADLPASSGH